MPQVRPGGCRGGGRPKARGTRAARSPPPSLSERRLGIGREHWRANGASLCSAAAKASLVHCRGGPNWKGPEIGTHAGHTGRTLRVCTPGYALQARTRGRHTPSERHPATRHPVRAHSKRVQPALRVAKRGLAGGVPEGSGQHGPRMRAPSACPTCPECVPQVPRAPARVHGRSVRQCGAGVPRVCARCWSALHGLTPRHTRSFAQLRARLPVSLELDSGRPSLGRLRAAPGRSPQTHLESLSRPTHRRLPSARPGEAHANSDSSRRPRPRALATA